MPKLFDKYKEEGAYQNPVEAPVKDKEYVLRKIQHIFSKYVRGVDAVPWYSDNGYSVFRQYGAGEQSEDIYKPFFYGKKGKSVSSTFNSAGVDIGGTSESAMDSTKWLEKAYGHINWRVVSPMPKIKNKILSAFTGSYYDIFINCIDENSIDKEADKKWRAWVESQEEIIALMQHLSQVSGMPYKMPDKLINTPEELELYEANGGFKLNYAKEGEKVIKHSWQLSNGDEIDEKIVNDLIDLGIAGYRVIYDREIGKEVIQYLDPEFCGIQYSKHNDFRDSTYAYEVRLVPAYKLVQQGLSIEKLPSIVREYADNFGNPMWKDAYETVRSESDIPCGFFKVPVLDIEWIDVDIKRQVKYNTKYGQPRVKSYTSGESLTANKQYEEVRIQKTYQAEWVIGSDILLNWGIKPNQPRRDKRQAVLSFHFIRGKTKKSLVQQLMPILDQFQLTWLKFQDALAKAAPDGIAIEWGSLQGMKLGGAKMNPLDVIRMYRANGTLFYSSHQRHLGNSPHKPIQELPGGYGRTLADLIGGLDINARLIEEITGINPVALGSQVAPGTGKAVTEMAVSASASPIKNIFDKVFQLKAHASLDLLQRIQLDMRYSESVKKRYRELIGEFGVKTLVEAEGHGVKFGFNLVPRPTDEDIAQIQEYVGIALQNGRNGLPGLSVDEALYVMRRLREGGNLKELELYIGFRINQKERQQREAAAAAAQQNAESAQQLDASKQEGEANKINLEMQKQLAIDGNKSDLDKDLQSLKHDHKMDEIAEAGKYRPLTVER